MEIAKAAAVAEMAKEVAKAAASAEVAKAAAVALTRGNQNATGGQETVVTTAATAATAASLPCEVSGEVADADDEISATTEPACLASAHARERVNDGLSLTTQPVEK